MKNDKNSSLIAVIALCFAVIGLSVGFAALSTSLQINGSAIVQTSSWDVHFNNLSDVTLVGNASVSTAPTIKTNSTHIGDFDVRLKQPNDSVSYDFDIVNAGSYDAKITSLVKAGVGSKTITLSGEESSKLDGKVFYTLVYKKVGTGLSGTTSSLSVGNAVSSGDVLKAGETVTCTLTIALADLTSDQLPSSNVSIGGLDITIVYGQA